MPALEHQGVDFWRAVTGAGHDFALLDVLDDLVRVSNGSSQKPVTFATR